MRAPGPHCSATPRRYDRRSCGPHGIGSPNRSRRAEASAIACGSRSIPMTVRASEALQVHPRCDRPCPRVACHQDCSGGPNRGCEHVRGTRQGGRDMALGTRATAGRPRRPSLRGATNRAPSPVHAPCHASLSFVMTGVRPVQPRSPTVLRHRGSDVGTAGGDLGVRVRTSRE